MTFRLTLAFCVLKLGTATTYAICQVTKAMAALVAPKEFREAMLGLSVGQPEIPENVVSTDKWVQ